PDAVPAEAVQHGSAVTENSRSAGASGGSKITRRRRGAKGRSLSDTNLGFFSKLLGLNRFDDDSGAISQDLGDALHHLGCVIARADDRVGAEIAGVLQHQVKRLGACLLAEVG